jgi:A/G-specific adenine glycosylase
VSEIMLQQTQVKTVFPYWERWMRELPTIHSLAEAPMEKVLKLWEGLGYYRRARAMKKAAELLAETHNGIFPESYDAILDLPGVGPYTAGAICSIAFNQPKPIVDGNVIRVLTRLERISRPVDDPKVKARLWRTSGQMVLAAEQIGSKSGGKACSHFNQGLMELGATICLPRNPLCMICPVQSSCKAFACGDQEKFPRLPDRAKFESRQYIAMVVERNGAFLVRQREAEAVNGGFWEFPNWQVHTESGKAPLLSRFGLNRDSLPFAVIRHTITRYKNKVSVYRLPFAVAQRSVDLKTCSWKSPAQLHALPFASAHSRIRNLVAPAAPGAA